MSYKFCKIQLYSSYFLGFDEYKTKLYTIFYYFRNSLSILYGEIYLLKVTILQRFYLLFSVSLIINIIIIEKVKRDC